MSLSGIHVQQHDDLLNWLLLNDETPPCVSWANAPHAQFDNAQTLDEMIASLPVYPYLITDINLSALAHTLHDIRHNEALQMQLMLWGIDPSQYPLLYLPAEFNIRQKVIEVISNEFKQKFINQLKQAKTLAEYFGALLPFPGNILTDQGELIEKSTLQSVLNALTANPTGDQAFAHSILDATNIQFSAGLKATILSHYRQYTAYPRFIANLAKTQMSTNIPSELLMRISAQDLNKIFSAFTAPNANMQVHLLAIGQLQPGQSHRLDKRLTQLPRTVNIIRAPDGEFKCYVETKSKQANGQKLLNQTASGSTKKGKAAWRIDGDYTEYFHLTQLFKNNQEIQKLIDEVNISQSLDEHYASVMDFGPIYYDKHNRLKAGVYAVKAENGSLRRLFDIRKQFTNDQKNNMITDLLLAVKHLHDNNIVHQDIKPANILIDGNLRAKLTDFGLSKRLPSLEQADCTVLYQSPEISSTKLHDFYYNSHYGLNSYGYQFYRNTPSQYWGSETLGRVHKANDMWALGITIFYLKHRRLPSYNIDQRLIQSDPLLRGLLTGRSTRFTIDQAITAHNAELSPIGSPAMEVSFTSAFTPMQQQQRPGATKQRKIREKGATQAKSRVGAAAKRR